DVHQQGVHLRTVRKLPEQSAERAVDLAKLLAIEVQIDRLLRFQDILVLELCFLLAPRLQRIHLLLPIEEVTQRNDTDEETHKEHRLGQRRPSPRILRVEVLELIEEFLHVGGPRSPAPWERRPCPPCRRPARSPEASDSRSC